MDKKFRNDSIIYKYLKKYQEEPNSRIFAPLAEAYRKAGLVREAIEIAKEGLQVHPGFIGGKVALARAYFDQGEYQNVIDLLTQVVRDVPDNLIAQKVLGDACLMLGKTTEALNAYKMLLYFSPLDDETAKVIQELESNAYERGELILRADPPKNPADGFEVSELGVENKPRTNEEIARHKKILIQKIEFLQSRLQNVERYKKTLER